MWAFLPVVLGPCPTIIHSMLSVWMGSIVFLSKKICHNSVIRLRNTLMRALPCHIPWRNTWPEDWNCCSWRKKKPRRRMQRRRRVVLVSVATTEPHHPTTRTLLLKRLLLQLLLQLQFFLKTHGRSCRPCNTITRRFYDSTITRRATTVLLVVETVVWTDHQHHHLSVFRHTAMLDSSPSCCKTTIVIPFKCGIATMDATPTTTATLPTVIGAQSYQFPVH